MTNLPQLAMLMYPEFNHFSRRRSSHTISQLRRFICLLVVLVSSSMVTEAGSFVSTAALGVARDQHAATLLTDGRVLVTGGLPSTGLHSLGHTEIYDPATGGWSNAGHMTGARAYHTATLLPSGKVLVAGGRSFGADRATAELYDPISGTWSTTGSLTHARADHTATLLPNGKVLVVGTVGAAELYDPATGLWTLTGSSHVREKHVATLLPNGTVMIAGGNALSVEIYDPGTGNWTGTGSLTRGRNNATSTLLPNGKVLVAGGDYTTSAEIYDPASGSWSSTGSMITPRGEHTATLLPDGRLLVTGGSYASGFSRPKRTGSCEIYDFNTETWTATTQLIAARHRHTATLLASGKVLISAGYGRENDYSTLINSAELFEPANHAVRAGPPPPQAGRTGHTATLLFNGNVYVAGGTAGPVGHGIYTSGTNTWSSVSGVDDRRDHTATPLQDGKLLIVGGRTYTGTLLNTAQVYDPATNNLSSVGPLASARKWHSSTLLPDGKVLVAGGYNGTHQSTCQVFDPVSQTWSKTTSMVAARSGHKATLLPNGKVLVTGGWNGSSYLQTCELYDPVLDIWSTAAAMSTGRVDHTVTSVSDGTAFIVGGYNGGYVGTTEVYNPATNQWAIKGTLTTPRRNHTTTLLPSGQLAVTGGYAGAYLSSIEIYDPATAKWSSVSNLSIARSKHTATLLPNGELFVVGGYGVSGVGSPHVTTEIVNLGFNLAWQPMISSVNVDGSGRLVINGSGFLGISGASSGATNDSSTGFPVRIQWRSLTDQQNGILKIDPSTQRSDTTVSSAPGATLPLGYNFVSFITNGIPSMGKVIFISSPDISVEQPAGMLVSNGASRSAQIPASTAHDFVFTLRNPGTAELTGISLTKDGPDAADFTVTSSPAGSLNPGESTTFTVQFYSTVSGTKSTTLHIASNAPDKSPFDVTLTAVALPPDIEVEQPAGVAVVHGGSLSQGKMVVGNPVRQEFTIRNSGAADLSGLSISITGVNASDYSVITPPLPDVSPGGSQVFTLEFNPASGGNKSASINIQSNDPDESPYNINLSGQAFTLNQLAGADLSGANLQGANLSGADLSGTNLTNSNLDGVNLSNANLAGVNLSGASLVDVSSGSLTGVPASLPTSWVLFNGYLIGPGANLRDSNFAGLNLRGINFTGVDLEGADMTGSFAIVDTATDEFDTPSGASYSLREVLRDAPSGLTVTFEPALAGQTILLTNSIISISTDVTVDASALAGGIILDGNNTTDVLAVYSGRRVTLKNLTITRGIGFEGGGLISGGILSMYDSTISGNSADSGGGVLNFGTLTMHRCTISNNTSDFEGAGFQNLGTIVLNQCTVAENTTFGFGGGMYSNGPVTLDHCTISANSADSGGGIASFNGGIYQIQNTIIADNIGTTDAPDISLRDSQITLTGANLVSSLDGSTLIALDDAVSVAAPMLAALGQYGGPTATMALLSGSPARDTSFSSHVSIDQRGFPVVGLADIGAYESGTFSTQFLWETESFPLTATTAERAPGFDFDGDGQTNSEEWNALTHPADASSFFSVTITKAAVGFEVSVQTVVGRNYTLMQSSTLDANSFVPAPGFAMMAGDGQLLTFQLADPLDLPKFYLVQVTLP